MAPNLVVRADVIRLDSDTPTVNDAFLVDTNVWYWMTYTRASQGNRPPWPYQMQHYPNFINRALAAKAHLHWCGLTLAELAHRIEATEFEIFASSHTGVRPKEYRHNYSTERANAVLPEIQAAWAQVRTMGISLDLLINESATTSALARLGTESVDGYDLFILEAMSRNGITQIITDDGDFATVPGIQVFTANDSTIRQARTQGKLVAR